MIRFACWVIFNAALHFDYFRYSTAFDADGPIFCSCNLVLDEQLKWRTGDHVVHVPFSPSRLIMWFMFISMRTMWFMFISPLPDTNTACGIHSISISKRMISCSSRCIACPQFLVRGSCSNLDFEKLQRLLRSCPQPATECQSPFVTEGARHAALPGGHGDIYDDVRIAAKM